jgi:hypothetical protein
MSGYIHVGRVGDDLLDEFGAKKGDQDVVLQTRDPERDTTLAIPQLK